jgi:enoyl-CoA hydratase/carnithine racemase
MAWALDPGPLSAERTRRSTGSDHAIRDHREAEQFHVQEVSPSYWRVTFDNGPVNLLDPDTVEQLAALIARIETAPDLTVVVFRSEKPGFFIAHWDFLSDNTRIAGMQPGPTGLHPYVDNFIRLSRVPVATICELRGRTRGAGSEFALATDIRFASEKAVLGQFEVGVGAVPGGGPMARLGRLVGRAPARFPPIPELPDFLRGRAVVIIDGAALLDDGQQLLP